MCPLPELWLAITGPPPGFLVNAHSKDIEVAFFVEVMEMLIPKSLPRRICTKMVHIS